MALATLCCQQRPKPETYSVSPYQDQTLELSPVPKWYLDHCNPCLLFVITEVPDAPKQPVIKEVYHDSALVCWEPPADGGKPITGYIVERKETMANRWNFQISLVDFYSKY